MPPDTGLDVEKLMRQIRSDADRILNNAPTTFRSAAAIDRLMAEGAAGLAGTDIVAHLARKTSYRYTDFLPLEGRTFVMALYACLLKREPDAREMEPWLEAMRDKGVSKEEMIATISQSSEGRAQNVPLDGPGRARVLVHRLMRLPYAGYALRLVMALIRLPNAGRERAAEVMRLSDALQTAQSELRALRQEQAARQEDSDRRLDRVRDDLRAHLQGHAVGRQAGYLADDLISLDDLAYVAFEDTFRGSREEIKKRLEVYLPYVQRAGAGREEAPILDIGCGRGEWLELCRDHGYAARGIDLNPGMVDHCTALGLSATLSEAVAALEGLPDASLGAITSFHLIEHLGLDSLRGLFAACLRVLRPGGFVLFETPNPENLVVGACNFYIDPSHLRPIPPVTLSFLLTRYGFAEPEVLRLHPLNMFDCPEDAPPTLRRLSDLVNGPLDYCAIATKK